MASPAIFSGRRSKLLTADGLLNSNGSINDNDGLINYIKNGHAEVNTTGWATYADAAGARPVDGTGGAPTVTLTRSTSSPLRGQGSFLLTKDAANRQGEGASYDFTIDAADQAKVLQISMDYSIASGTYAGGTSSTDSDLIVDIYDVTNAVLIEPAPIKLDGAVVGVQYKFTSSFQSASNSTSYRLIIHTATTSASAYTVNLDNVKVSPQVVSVGGSITDPIAYTPTFTGFGTVSGVTFRSWRAGAYLFVEGNFTSGTSTATEARINLGFNGVDGIVTSSASIATIEVAGTYATDVSSTNSHGGFVLIEPSKGYLTFGSPSAMGSATVNPAAKANGNAILNSTDKMHFTARIPITGWATSQVLSSETDTRVVSCIINGAPANVTAANPIIFPTIIKDTHGAYNATSGQYTAPFSGFYQVQAFVNCTAGSNAVLYAYVNAVQQGPTMANVPSALARGGGLTTVYATAGQTIDVRPDQNLTSFTGATVNGVTITRVSGPSQIAASESVIASYGRNATQSINTGTDTTILWDTLSTDTHSAYNTSTGIFTVPVSGKYQIDAMLDFGTSTAGSQRVVRVSKNSVLNRYLINTVINTNNNTVANGSTTLPFVAGDTIQLTCRHNVGTSTNIAGDANISYFTIKKVGN